MLTYLILASASPRRREFLGSLGLPFIIRTPAGGGVDETPRPGESPAELVQRLSRLKASAVLAGLPADLPLDPPVAPGQSYRLLVVAADTEVALDGEILGKPAGPAEALAMLRRLRQVCHYVYSGLTVAEPPAPGRPARLITRLHTSRVWLRDYDEAELAAYVAGGSPLDKAGAYGIQDAPFNPVARLEGCYASVMGLPLGELAAALAEAGVSSPPIAPLCRAHTGAPCCQEGAWNVKDTRG